MPRFEYLVVNTVGEGVVHVNGKQMVGYIWDYLNARGAEGWELVSVTAWQSGGRFTYTLKRPLL